MSLLGFSFAYEISCSMLVIPDFLLVTATNGQRCNLNDFKEILLDIERHLLVDCREDAHSADGKQERVAVRLRIGNVRAPNDAGASGPAVDKERLTPLFLQAVTNKPREDVGCAPRRILMNDSDGFARVSIGIPGQTTSRGRRRRRTYYEGERLPAIQHCILPRCRLTKAARMPGCRYFFYVVASLDRRAVYWVVPPAGSGPSGIVSRTSKQIAWDRFSADNYLGQHPTEADPPVNRMPFE